MGLPLFLRCKTQLLYSALSIARKLLRAGLFYLKLIANIFILFIIIYFFLADLCQGGTFAAKMFLGENTQLLLSQMQVQSELYVSFKQGLLSTIC